jgi:uncharacterized protein (TIGR02246 family)
MSTEDLKLQLLTAFADAWNRHDVDALMSMMTDDGVFEASSGGDVDGQRHKGPQAVRAAYAGVFAQFPDAHWGDARHLWPATAAFPSGHSRAPDRTGIASRSTDATCSSFAATRLP